MHYIAQYTCSVMQIALIYKLLCSTVHSAKHHSAICLEVKISKPQSMALICRSMVSSMALPWWAPAFPRLSGTNMPTLITFDLTPIRPPILAKNMPTILAPICLFVLAQICASIWLLICPPYWYQFYQSICPRMCIKFDINLFTNSSTNIMPTIWT